MELELRNYKRFEGSKVNLDGDVIAIVGPNEAGKSSLLQALFHLNDATAFTREEITRGASIKDDDVVIQARFLLEEEDKNAVKDVKGSHQLRWFIIYKRKDGAIYTSAEPRLTRDLKPQRELIQHLGKIRESVWRGPYELMRRHP